MKGATYLSAVRMWCQTSSPSDIECVAGDDLGGEVGSAVAECVSGVSVELGLITCERNIFYIGSSPATHSIIRRYTAKR